MEGQTVDADTEEMTPRSGEYNVHDVNMADDEMAKPVALDGTEMFQKTSECF